MCWLMVVLVAMGPCFLLKYAFIMHEGGEGAFALTTNACSMRVPSFFKKTCAMDWQRRQCPRPPGHGFFQSGLTGKSVGFIAHEKESVVLLKLAHWQVVHVQTVMEKNMR